MKFLKMSALTDKQTVLMNKSEKKSVTLYLASKYLKKNVILAWIVYIIYK